MRPTNTPFGESFLAVLRRIVELEEDARENRGDPLWYRGHADANWVLHSGLHRHNLDLHKAVEDAGTSAPTPMEMIREEFKSLYRNFVSEAFPLLTQSERSLWGELFAMQHYGHPTRLMDWSLSFAVALYFAQLRDPTQTGAIVILRPQAFNEALHGAFGLIALTEEPGAFNTEPWHPRFLLTDAEKTEGSYLKHFALRPEMRNARMIAQKSRFVMCGDDFTPLEQRVPKAFETILLGPNTFEDAERFLRLAGVDAHSLFPDHEGLRAKRASEKQLYLRMLKNRAQELSRQRSSEPRTE